MGYPARDVDKGEVTQLPVGSVQACRQLSCQLENQARIFTGNLPESRVGHFGDFALGSGANPGAASRSLVEQSHLAKEFAFVEIGKHHFVAVLVFDHYFDRSVHDVIKNIGKIAGVNNDGFCRDGANPAKAQELVDCRYVAYGFRSFGHSRVPGAART